MDNRLKYYLRKTKSLPPEVVIKKIFSKVKHKGLDTISKISANIFGTEMTEAEFLRKVWNSKHKFEDLEELQKYFRERKKPKFFIYSSKREDIVSSIYEHCPDAPDTIISRADKICEHIFDLLGSEPVKVYYGMKGKGFKGHRYNTQINNKELTTIHHSPFTIHDYEPIDWHIDFKSGYRWNPKTYYRDIKYGHRLGVDVKVPWELSRFQHLTTLGEAYFLSKNEKYVKEFIDQVNDWIENNPPRFAVNWACTMDVAIRACNWLLAWEFFKDSPLISNEFIIRFFKSLLQHGRHIKKNLEYNETLTSNHYLSDIVGLIYLGVLIPKFKESEQWKNFGIEGVKKEMKKQVYPDGVDFEASTCYHRLVLELFFYTAFLVIINDKNFKEENFIEVGNEIFGEKYLQHLYKMFQFVLYALKPKGRMPQIGDNDSGRLHIFTNREVLDMRYLLTLGAIFFKEPKFKIKEFGFCKDTLWVFGEKSYKIWRSLEENCLANIGSKAFPDAGWYMMRNNKDYMIISCGLNGQNGNGGHCHNDKLSFELCIDGKDIIVDPGTYVYTADPKWRNKFRSTAYHNTGVIDDKEQNSFDENNLFWMKNEAKVKVNKWETTERYDLLDVEHKGYERLKEFVIHRRQIYFDKTESYWVIRDILSGKGVHQFDLYFHFASIEVEPDDKFPLVVSTRSEGANLAIIPLGMKEVFMDVLEGWVSYRYGVKVKAPIVRYRKKTGTPANFYYILYPYLGGIDIDEVMHEVKKSKIIEFLKVEK